MHSFGDITFKEERNLATAVNSARICLTEDTDPPVIVEAAIALQFLIEKQEGCKLIKELVGGMVVTKESDTGLTLWK